MFGGNMRTHGLKKTALRNQPLVKWLVLCALFCFTAFALTSCGKPNGTKEQQMVMRVVPNGTYVRTDGGKGTIEVNDAKVVIRDLQMEERMISYFTGNTVLLDYQINKYMGYKLSNDQYEQLREYYTELFRTYDCNGEWRLVDENLMSPEEDPLVYLANLKRDWKKTRETSPEFVRVTITYNYATATLNFAGFDYIPEEFADG